MGEAMSALEGAFKDLAQGRAVVPTRVSLTVPEEDGWFGVMPAYLPTPGALSTKIVSLYGKNQSRGLPAIMATVVVNDASTGGILAIMEGSYITALRTGALGGLGAKYLSREDSHTATVFGAGVQARTQLAALSEARTLTKVKVYDSVPKRAEAFAAEMGDRLRVPVVVSSDNKEAVEGSDILITVTTSKEPVFDGRLVQPGTHINAFGNFKPGERELDTETVKKSRVVADLKEAALAEAGDLIIPIREGSIDESHVLGSFGDVLLGSLEGRRSPEDITLFKSVGLGIQDCAVAWLAYQKASKLGVGTQVDL